MTNYHKIHADNNIMSLPDESQIVKSIKQMLRFGEDIIYIGKVKHNTGGHNQIHEYTSSIIISSYGSIYIDENNIYLGNTFLTKTDTLWLSLVNEIYVMDIITMHNSCGSHYSMMSNNREHAPENMRIFIEYLNKISCKDFKKDISEWLSLLLKNKDYRIAVCEESDTIEKELIDKELDNKKIMIELREKIEHEKKRYDDIQTKRKRHNNDVSKMEIECDKILKQINDKLAEKENISKHNESVKEKITTLVHFNETQHEMISQYKHQIKEMEEKDKISERSLIDDENEIKKLLERKEKIMKAQEKIDREIEKINEETEKIRERIIQFNKDKVSVERYIDELTDA